MESQSTPAAAPGFTTETRAGEASAAPSLPAATGVGAVHLAVTDGSRAMAFYRDMVGLAPISVGTDEIHMGVGVRDLVVLYPGAISTVVPGRTGLYHLALVLPNRRELARVIARLMSMRVPNSPTDHVMTKSDYLWDPDGNGIEIYAESPEDGTINWSSSGFGAFDKDGRPRSGRDPIDLRQLFGQLAPDDRLNTPLPDETRMGHVHLHVRDVEEALGFYHDLIGFDIMGLSLPIGAAFISAGGYHHHLGLNTWAGQGAPPAPPDTAGLRRFTIELPTAPELEEVVAHLRGAGMEVEERPDGFYTQDPSSNRVQLKVRAG